MKIRGFYLALRVCLKFRADSFYFGFDGVLIVGIVDRIEFFVGFLFILE